MRTPLTLAALVLALIVAAVAGAVNGAVRVDPATLLAAVLHPFRHDTAGTILWSLRYPRVIVAATVGAALALAGTLLQGLLRNPLVDPSIVGVSGGAGAAVAIAVALGAAPPALPPIGFAAGLGTAFLVATIARRGSALDATRLILAGISLSALFAAVVALVITSLAPFGAAQQILAWLAGSIGGRDWSDLRAVTPYLVIAAVTTGTTIGGLDVLQLGERRATALGLHVGRLQWTVLAAAALFTAAAVALAGIVGFVGLIVPHLARRLIGHRHSAVFPAAALLGATLTIVADTISRTLVAPRELPLSVLLAFVGVPAFLYLFTRRSSAREILGA